MTIEMSDTQARLVATLALADDMSLLEMSRHFRDLSENLKREAARERPSQYSACQYCSAGVFCWWHATHEQHMQHRRNRKSITT